MIPAIEASGLGKRFTRRGPLVVDDLSLTAQPGEIVGLLGPNGAGKTTTLLLLLGLLAPTRGDVRLLGKPPDEISTRALLGYVPDGLAGYDHFTGLGFVEHHARLHGMTKPAARARARELLAMLDLEGSAGTRLGTWSRGMLQRGALAQALVKDPLVLLLDEPAAGLDPFGVILVRDILIDLRSRGAAILLNSHQLSEMERVCDRVAFIKDGRLLQTCRVAEITEGLEARFLSVLGAPRC